LALYAGYKEVINPIPTMVKNTYKKSVAFILTGYESIIKPWLEEKLIC